MIPRVGSANPLVGLGTCAGYWPKRYADVTGLWQSLLDASGNGRDLTTFAVGAVSSAFVRGYLANAAVTLQSTNAAFRLSGACSVLCLVRGGWSGNPSGDANIVVCDQFGVNRGRYYLQFRYVAGAYYLAYQHAVDGGGYLALNGPRVPKGAEPMVIGFSRNADGKTVSLYLQGALVASTVFATACTAQLSPILQIGGVASTTNFFDGVIEDVAIYSTELSARAHAIAARYLLRRRR